MGTQCSRYEVNREIRNVLLRHDADLLFLDYSFIGQAVYISGYLTRPFHVEFSVTLIEELIKDLRNIPHIIDVQFDLDNWSITSSASRLNIHKLKVRTPFAGVELFDLETAEGTYNIDDEEIMKVPRDAGRQKSKR